MKRMEGFYEWIRGITYYLIFITVAVNLLPDKKYEKYIRFFSGMVLILLVLKPLTGGLRLDDKLAYYFESITFKKEAGELKGRISQMENQRLDAMISQYEEAVETDLKTMAEAEGFWCFQAEASIDREEESASFGHVVKVRLLLSMDGENMSQIQKEMLPVEQVRQVEVQSPKVELSGGEKDMVEELPDEEGTGEEKDTEEARKQKTEGNSRLSGLRRRIAEYYDLEEQDIEIQMENGKG